ncbi:MAG: aldehyde dehydrogenase family protein [Nocardioidaceae bacterium]
MTSAADEAWSRQRVAELNRRNGRHGVSAPEGRPTLAGDLATDHPSDAARADSELARARQMLQQAEWAARAYGGFDKASVDRIVRAVAEAAAEKAAEYAEWAVQETGFGVAEHKIRKNLACSIGLLEEHAGDDFVTPRVDDRAKIVEVPRPAGVVLALTPSTNPVATTYFKAILALMTRNAVVISPHPMAKAVCADAARTLARAAEAAGAPAGIVQCVENPTVPLVEAIMADERVGVVVATGGTGMVRAAYSSGNPALGVGPGNVPVLVDATADLRLAAARIVDSKAFDNSVLCTNESVLIVEESVADKLLREMERVGAHLLDQGEVDQLTAYMFPADRLNTDVVGKDAAIIARGAGIRSGPGTKVLLAPFDAAVPEQMMTHEKLSPVLGVLRVPDASRGIEAARSIVRIAGAGHSAAIHSSDPDTIMRFTASVPVLRVAVNVGNSTGSSGLDTNLAPTMTIGTGFVGRSSIGENLEPRHLVNWARIAYNSDPGEAMPDYHRLSPWQAPHRAVPRYPWPSNDPRAAGDGAPGPTAAGTLAVDRVTAAVVDAMSPATDMEALRAEIRRLVASELSRLSKG